MLNGPFDRSGLTNQRIMKKLASANPSLTYPQRRALLLQFIPTDLEADDQVAGHLERSVEEVERFVQSVRDDFCADTIVDWA